MLVLSNLVRKIAKSASLNVLSLLQKPQKLGGDQLGGKFCKNGQQLANMLTKMNS